MLIAQTEVTGSTQKFLDEILWPVRLNDHNEPSLAFHSTNL